MTKVFGLTVILDRGLLRCSSLGTLLLILNQTLLATASLHIMIDLNRTVQAAGAGIMMPKSVSPSAFFNSEPQ